jgi:tetratricopeptide (TPR) repeat protein
MDLRARLNQAAICLSAREYATAEHFAREALRDCSDDFNVWHLMGIIRAETNDLAAALDFFDEALRRYQGSAQLWANRAHALVDLQRLAEAVDSYDAALALDPRQIEWWHRRGTALAGLRRYAAALESYDRALALDASSTLSLNARGVVLEGMGRALEAADCYRRAIALQPRYATPYSNLGRVQRESGDLAGAIDSFRTAVALAPDFAVGHNNLGCALYDHGDFSASIASFRRALALDPNLAECEYSLALALLKTRDFAGGWQAFESRLRVTSRPTTTPPAGLFRWHGEALGQRTLVLVAEQGFGDVIHFCRYASRLNARGIWPVLQADRRLHTLLQTTGYFAGFTSPGSSFDADRHLWFPLMSLPLLLHEDLTDVPSPHGYLRPDPARIEHWRDRVLSVDALRVGIAWQGNARSEIGSLRGRSMPLAQYEPLANVPGVVLISLQKGQGAGQLAEEPFGPRVLDWSSQMDAGDDAFVDTAAIMANLDLVITVDTAVAHLAGALGRPVWLALHRASDWRWFESSDRSPWYQTMQLFRQPIAGEWQPVIAAMRERLLALAQSRQVQRS